MDDNSIPPIGDQIRSLRKAEGWSLAELARRVGSSAPTLHRYESGWDRFELSTLRKLAAALGARLEVRLVRELRAEPADRPAPRELARLLAPVFWDKDLSPSDLSAYPQWVLCRVLMFGDRSQVAACRRFYGDAAIAEAAARRGVDERTRNYWTLVLGAPAEATGSAGRGGTLADTGSLATFPGAGNGASESPEP